MFTRRVLQEMFATAFYFAGCGADWCASALAANGAVFGFFLGLCGGWAEHQSKYLGFSFLIGITANAIMFSTMFYLGGFLLGLVWGGFVFFCAGLRQGIKPQFDRKGEATRYRRAIQWASPSCGWASVATALSVMASQGRFRSASFFPPNSSTNTILEVCLYCLVAGNLFGIALAAISPGTIEKVREAINSLFASVQRT